MGNSARIVVVLLIGVSAGACASSGAVPSPFPRPAPAPEGPVPSMVAGTTGDPERAALIGTALTLRGAPYRDGGSDPSGFDCSGFVAYVFAQRGLFVPRTVAEQFQAGQSVPPASIEPGDLVFFSTTAPGASHVGIAMGGGEFVHAPSSAGVVRVEHLGASYWASRYVGARRVP